MRIPGTRKSQALLALGLTILVIAVFGQTVRFGFIGLDDDAYVTGNPMVRAGLTARGAAWALGTFHRANWHPLTWLSHMADVEMYGLRAGGHHATSVLLHAANAVLLFWLLSKTTGRPGRAWIAAGLFAVHPLRVESVAWIAERKDVSSAFCFLAALLAYSSYALRGGAARYLAALALFALGLLAKPMLVTLPFVLLLLDAWPLRRLAASGATPPPTRAARSLRGLLVEKVPFFVLAGASCAVTLAAQRAGGALSNLDAIPLGPRIANATISYVAYLGKMAWPASLSPFYPHPWLLHGAVSWWKAAGAAVLLVVASIGFLRAPARRPWLAVGWLWYLGSMVPVIGFVQVGGQAMADRYSYLPSIGICVIVVWGLAESVGTGPMARRALAGAAAVAIAASAVAAAHQTSYWSDPASLFGRAVRVTPGSWLAHCALGMAMESQGRIDAAEAEYREALRILPGFPDASYNLATVFMRQGRAAEAAAEYRRLLERAPDHVRARNNLGAILARTGRLDEAAVQFREVLRLQPDNEEARRNLDAALRMLGAGR